MFASDYVTHWITLPVFSFLNYQSFYYYLYGPTGNFSMKIWRHFFYTECWINTKLESRKDPFKLDVISF